MVLPSIITLVKLVKGEELVVYKIFVYQKFRGKSHYECHNSINAKNNIISANELNPQKNKINR